MKNQGVPFLLVLGCIIFTVVAQSEVNDSMKAHHLSGQVVKLLQKQVGFELHASLSYMAMAAHFGSEGVNRHGFAKFFRESAFEEFKHAQKFIQYMNKRGVPPLDGVNFKINTPLVTGQENGLNAMRLALELEGFVTEKLLQIHKLADGDGHLTNFLESEFLEEQVNSMRELSGYVHNLHGMMHNESHQRKMLAEYLFDLQLQRQKDEL